MNIIHEIKMELDRCSMPEFDAVCSDACTRVLRIALFSGGSRWLPPADTSVSVRYQKSDGTTGVYDLLPDGSAAGSVQGNVVAVTLAPQATTAPGPVVLTVCLTQAERQISTFRILMRVCPAVGVAASESGNYWYLSGCLPQPEDAAEGEVLVVDRLDPWGRVAGLKTAVGPGLSPEQAGALEGLLALAVYAEDPSGARAAFRAAFGLEGIPVPATGITLSSAALSFTDNGPRQLSAVLTPSNTTDLVLWTTSDPAVATVSAGLVTPAGSGSCVITATAGSISAVCAVTVSLSAAADYTVTRNLTHVSCSQNADTVEAGGTLTAELTAEEGYALDGITVTMDGVDITAWAVTGNRISITNVSGSIVITASAVRLWSVTASLTHMTVTNEATAVGNGSAYVTRLKAEMGYLPDSVTVTMGGADVTDRVYAAGKITVGNVTGDLVITASAVEDSRELLYYWDFTESLTDGVGGTAAVLTGAAQSSDGIRIGVNSDTVALGNLWSTNRTVEVDIGSEVPTLNYTKVLVMFGGSNGFSYGVNGGWGIYAGGTWNYLDPQITDSGYFCGTTLALKVSADGIISVCRDGELLLTTTLTCTEENQSLNLGTQGSGYNSVNPVVITGCRIYEGVA